MRILTSAEVLQAELETISRAGMSALVLMQRAGYAVAQFCLSHYKFRSVSVVCGRDSNGGDGMAAAESLREIVASVSVLILAKEATELSDEAAAMCSRLTVNPIWIADEAGWEDPAVQDALRADLIIDAIAGADFKPPLEGLARKAVAAINDAFGTIVSVDVPSGVDADGKSPMHESGDDVVFAHGIITFIAPKPAHVFGELTSGPIAVSEIGVQPALVPNSTGLSVITGQAVGITFPPRLNDANKGQFGHVLVIAGSLGQAGAAGLAGMAALRTGAGLVTVACPKSIQATVAGFAPELMTEGLKETVEGTISMEASGQLESLMTGKDVIVLGPGLSRNPETASLVRRLVVDCVQPLVLDADGLNAFEGHYHELKRDDGAAPFRVLTPHPGEAARLIGVSTGDIQADRLDVARRISSETGSCVALKGWRTVVAGASGETWLNMTGNAALAKAGSGDVLSGMIGAALARHVGSQLPIREATGASELDSRVEEADDQHLARNSGKASAFLKDINAAAAVYLHGLAADIVRDILHENTMLATDLLENLTEAFRDCDLQMDRSLFYLHK
jgi:ADP-dependent NAD(P)H-hydrate dehydratase / NAD(P)H-hydrate epimerase